ncbi:MAG: hypothetical protein AAF821_00100 [Cyanobacteria bacterium P01_D01_bin.156]
MDSLGDFLMRFATYILNHGHYFYVADVISPGKDLIRVDDKMIRKYRIPHCRQTRKNRRDRGKASIHYVRFRNAFVLIASKGRSPFFDHEQWADIREEPIYFSGYSIGIRAGKSCIRIQGKRWIPLKNQFLGKAYCDIKSLQKSYDLITPFRFRGIIEQMEQLRKQINNKRRRASLPLLQFWDWRRGAEGKEQAKGAMVSGLIDG